jgi:RND family efflux transporter MFP subunit
MPRCFFASLPKRRWGAAWLLGTLLPLGCTETQSTAPTAPKPPEVQVSLPVTKEVIDYEDFTGRTEAIAMVEVRARVTGYLEKVLFTEGSEVEKGQALFEIDRRPYEAEMNRTQANLIQAEAHLKRLDADYRRAVRMLPNNSVSREEFDKIAGDRAEAEASVSVARASRDLARLNLDFTHVIAPLSGRTSRRLIDPGNMVKADETALTTIVTLDPMYVYFDVDERTLLRIRRLLCKNDPKATDKHELPILMGLADEEGYPREGRVNFEDNRVDSGTGTLRLRALFPNNPRVLSPGLFVRIHLPVGTPHSATLVAEQAIGTDQGQKFVYVVNDKDEVVYRLVKVGRLHDGLRVIEDGLAKTDRVIVTGIQRIRPGLKVQAKQVDMPAKKG